MSTARTTAQARRYARAIEQCWARQRETATVLSPKDWARICDWYTRGVPLQIVLEAIAAAFEKRPRQRRAAPRSLAYLAAAVEEAWSVLCEGRRGADAENGRPAPTPSLEAWRQRRDAETSAPVRAALDQFVSGMEAGRPRAPLLAELDASLREAVDPELLQAVREAVDRELAPYRDRLDDAGWRRAHERQLGATLRRELRLPRI